jgi:uncharacterized membrane protein (DUF485 family)
MSISKVTPPEVGSYAGALVTVATSLTLTEFGVIVGIATALLTFVLNAWYTHQRNAREHLLAELDRREREVRLAQLQAQLMAPLAKQ